MTRPVPKPFGEALWERVRALLDDVIETSEVDELVRKATELRRDMLAEETLRARF